MPQLFLKRVAVREWFFARYTPRGWVVPRPSEVSPTKVPAAYVASEEFEQKLTNFSDMQETCDEAEIKKCGK